MNTEETYKKKHITTDELLELVRPGNSIFLSSGPAIPAKSVEQLVHSPKVNNYDLEIIQLFTTGDYLTGDACENLRYRVKTFRTGESASTEACQGRMDYIPANLVEIPYIFATGSIETDIAIISTSPPDRRGYMSMGIAIDVAHMAIRNASLVIAEVNPNMPVTHGESTIHIDQVDHIIENDAPLPERQRKDFSELQDRIGWHIANLIQDGSTVVLHVGRTFDAVARHLKKKRNLGIYTNVVSDWVIDLIESGAIARNRDQSLGGQVSTSYCYGSRELYDYVDENRIFHFYPIAKLANPLNIQNISNLISIMNVEKIDITAGTIQFHAADDILSGYESKFNFAAGTAFSGKGKVIFALRSMDKEGRSNIQISLNREQERLRSTLGAPRYVVTEHGVASLFGKSIRERALAMISIAHPQHREDLLNQAKEAGYLFTDQIYKIKHAVNYPIELETVKSFRDGLEVKIRPIKPTDEDMMRRLFYKFSDESRYLRYFANIRIMPHKNMQKYVNIDYTKTLSIVAIVEKGNSERIVAEGRFAAYPDGERYDMAFLVDEDFQGRGLASFMVNYLVQIGQERGIKCLSASVLPQNEKMLSVFSRAIVKPKRHIESGIIELDFFLQEEETEES